MNEICEVQFEPLQQFRISDQETSQNGVTHDKLGLNRITEAIYVDKFKLGWS